MVNNNEILEKKVEPLDQRNQDYKNHRDDLIDQVKGYAHINKLKVKIEEKSKHTHFELFRKGGIFKKKEVMLKVFLPYSISYYPSYEGGPLVDIRSNEFSNLDLVKRFALFYKGNVTYFPVGKGDCVSIDTTKLDLSGLQNL